MSDNYNSYKKAELIRELERRDTDVDQLRHALNGLYTMVQPVYVMAPDAHNGFQDATFKAVLTSITNYNGYGDRVVYGQPNFLIDCFRDAVKWAEKALVKQYVDIHVGTGGNTAEGDAKAVEEYRGTFMMHNGWYRNDHGWKSDEVKIEVKGHVFYRVCENENGETMPDDYVWSRDLLKWVSPEDESKVWISKLPQDRKNLGRVPTSRRR